MRVRATLIPGGDAPHAAATGGRVVNPAAQRRPTECGGLGRLDGEDGSLGDGRLRAARMGLQATRMGVHAARMGLQAARMGLQAACRPGRALCGGCRPLRDPCYFPYYSPLGLAAVAAVRLLVAAPHERHRCRPDAVELVACEL